MKKIIVLLLIIMSMSFSMISYASEVEGYDYIIENGKKYNLAQVINAENELQNDGINQGNKDLNSDLLNSSSKYYNKFRGYDMITMGDAIWQTSGFSGDLFCQVNRSLATTLTLGSGINLEIFNAAVGVSIQKTVSVSSQSRVETKGKYTIVKAFPQYRVDHWDIYKRGWFGDSFIGKAKYSVPAGIQFRVYHQ